MIYKDDRPSKFKDIVGQDDAVKQIRASLKEGFPHVTMLCGPSGVGKTTLGRIISTHLKCDKLDFNEVNAASFRGIDTAREVCKTMEMFPKAGPCIVYLFDEVHKWTSDAQTAFLKPLEETPPHVYFVLLTTDPTKLKTELLGRCAVIKLQTLEHEHLVTIIKRSAKKHGTDLSDDVVSRIAEACSEGSARQALVIFEQVCRLQDEDSQLAAIAKFDPKVQAHDLCREILQQRPNWGKVKKILEGLDDPEGTRRIVLGYMAKVMLSGGKVSGLARNIWEKFQYNYFDTGKSGLIASAYDAVFRR